MSERETVEFGCVEMFLFIMGVGAFAALIFI